MRIARRTIRVSRRGNATLRLTCPRRELRCRTTIRLRRAGRQLARKRVTIAGGHTVRVTLHLSRRARLQLSRAGAMRATAVVTATDAGQNRRTTRTTIRLLAPGRR